MMQKNFNRNILDIKNNINKYIILLSVLPAAVLLSVNEKSLYFLLLFCRADI